MLKNLIRIAANDNEKIRKSIKFRNNYKLKKYEKNPTLIAINLGLRDLPTNIESKICFPSEFHSNEKQYAIGSLSNTIEEMRVKKLSLDRDV